MQLKQRDLRTPFNGENSRKIRARVDRISSDQATAADLTTTIVSDVEGQVQNLYLVVAAVAATGESMEIDVTVNGTSILDDPYTYDEGSAPASVIQIPVSKDVNIEVGDVIAIVRDYTAGGGATPIGASKVVLEVA